MSRRSADAPERSAPGTLTNLIEEVLRGTPGAPTDAGWGASLRTGEVIGRYDLLRELGRGGFAVVWEARDRELGRIVALKALRAAPAGTRDRRLVAEAEVAARLSHPNIVTVLDVGRCERGVYLVQELVEGTPLAERLAGGALAAREALRIATALARGLAHAHAHGVIHRDLSPSNVVCGDDGQVKILDLGMASALGRRKIDGGTADCMAPEQLAAAPEDERTDVFALGALAFRMLTGASPFVGVGPKRTRTVTRGIDVPGAPALGQLVEAMLAESPTDRPRDAQSVLEALEEVEAGWPAAPARPIRAKIRPPPRVRWAAAGLLAGVVATLAGGAWIGRGSLGGEGVPSAITVGTGSTRTDCAWRHVLKTDFDGRGPALRSRSGKFGGQGPKVLDDVALWSMESDWNQVWIPLGDWAPDVFSVEVEFRVEPDPERTHHVWMTVFTDPVGGMDAESSDLVHGVGIDLSRPPGAPPSLTWGPIGGLHGRADYRGVLPGDFTGGWHRLRLEGSRTRRWMRLTLDGQQILTDMGRGDLVGHHVCLGAGSNPYHPARVTWRGFAASEGTDACR